MTNGRGLDAYRDTGRKALALPEAALRRWPGKINDRVTKYPGGLERELRRIRQTDAGPIPAALW
jgi:hypothetical protein